MIETDICIIGAGPVGLFAVFEAGLLKMRCHLVDTLPQVGGQLSEIYPYKPIYDIPGYPEVKGLELVEKLMTQIEPFKPTFTLGERVEGINREPNKSFILTTNEGTMVQCRVIVIAGGLGCFEPRKPAIENLERYEGSGVDYMVKNPDAYQDKNVVLAGGGDSALDWTIFLSRIARRVTLVHRGDTFRGAPDSVQKVFELATQGKIDLLLKSHLMQVNGNNSLEEVVIQDENKLQLSIKTNHLIPLFGLSPKLGPISSWGLNIDQNAIEADTKDYSTNVERVYAIGDINIYPGKLKLILCGFHEAAIMMQSAFKYVYPNEKLSLKYTTVYGVNSF